MKKSFTKRLLSVLLSVVLVVGCTVLATSCNKDEETSSPSPTPTQAPTQTPTQPPTQTPTQPPATQPVSGTPIDELAVCVGPDPDTIDPALNSAVDGATLILHGFEGLYSLDKDGKPVPGQAESVNISADGTVYTFHLRKDLKWSDGTPLTANDFIYSWSRAIDPETAADYEYMFESIAGYADGELNVKAPDDNTLVVTLNTRTPYFLELTAFPVYYPVQQATVEENADAWATKPETYIGNGPYKMTEWVPGSHMVYVKNENYWNYDALGPEIIRFVLMEDDNAQLAAYNSGELQFIDTVPNDEIAALKPRDDFFIEGQIGTYYISFNTQKAPLDNPKFREALSLAIDRDYICVEIGQAGQVPAGAFVSLGISDSKAGSSFREVGGDYYDPTKEAYEDNLARAKEIIQELYPDGNVPTLEYLHNTSSGHALIAQALQQMWKEIGVNVTIQQQEWSTFLQTRKNGDYDIARNGWLNDYNDPIGMLDMFITGGGNNDGQWSNAEYDALITKAKTTSDQTERFKILHEAEDILFAESVFAPIYYYVDIFMINDNIQGFYSSPLGYKFFMYASYND